MAPSAINLPQCGAPPPEMFMDDDDQRSNDTELPHDYRCNQGLHTKSEIDKSREEFNWKEFNGSSQCVGHCGTNLYQV